MATLKTLVELKIQAQNCLNGKGKSYTTKDKANTVCLYNAMVYACESMEVTLVETRKDFSLGQIGEGLHNCVYNGKHQTRYAKAFSKDFLQGKMEVEVKVSVNNKDLCTSVTKPTRIHFLSPKGWVMITKAQIVEIFSDMEGYSEYITVTSTGFRLKLKAYELGTPIALLNTVFGL